TRTGEVHVAEGQYHLADVGGPDFLEYMAGGNGVIYVADGVSGVLPGTFDGPVRLTLAIGAGPFEASLDDWDDVVEISQHTVAGTVSIRELFGGERADFGLVETTPQSWIRVRVHVRGRDVAAELSTVPEKPVERHRIEIWPADEEPARILKQTDFF